MASTSSLLFVIIGTHLLAIENWRERLSGEAPTGWRALSEFYSHLECSWTENNTLNFSPTKNSQSKKRLLINGDLVRLELTDEHHRGVAVINPPHVFGLRRLSESQYMVNYYGTTDSFRVGNQFRPYIHAAFYFNNKPLWDWLKDPDFRTQEVVAVGSGDNRLIRWECKYTPTTRQSKRPVLPFTGNIVLDPSRYWCVRSYEAVYPDVKITGSVDYGQDIDSFPAIRSVSEFTKNNKDGREKRTDCSIQMFVRRRVPADQFTLAAFGLPDIGPVTGHQNRVWLWFLICSFLIGIATLLLRIYSRRVASKTP